MRLVPPVASRPPRTTVHRSRWAAIGAAVAITLGSGGLLTTSASISSGERGVFVPIAPCRLLDTRPAPDNVGPRNTKLGPGDTHTATIHGTNGNCTIPTDAVGITMNLAIINPTAASFLTVFPADAPRPLAANANWTANQPPLSNAVTADIGGNGQIAFYNLAGTVDIAADIVGYYIDHTHDDRYYTKTQTDTAINTATEAAIDTAVDTALAVPPPGATRVTIERLGSVGAFASVRIGANGFPVIAYMDEGAQNVKLASCANRGCTGGTTIVTVDGESTAVGNYLSMAIGADGNPVMAYFDSVTLDLKVAKCVVALCTGGGTVTTLDAPGEVGNHTSIAVGADGNPIVAYYDATNLDLKVAKCLNPACTGTPTITTVDAPGGVGVYTSIAIRSDGIPIVAYQNTDTLDLKVATCANPACTGSATITTVASAGSVGYFASLVIGADGNPVMSHHDFVTKDLLVTRCANPSCTGTSVTVTVDSNDDTGQFTSIARNPGGQIVIAYLDLTNDALMFATCATPGCTGTVSIVPIETNSVGYFASVAIGSDGLPVIAHEDALYVDLRFAKCASSTCLP